LEHLRPILGLVLASIRDDFDHAKGCLDINEMESSNESHQPSGLSLILHLITDYRDYCFPDRLRGRHPLVGLIQALELAEKAKNT